MQWFKLITTDNFPFGSIYFILFTVFVQWLSQKSTTTMRYSEQSKEFWWRDKMFFRMEIKFLRLMKGFKQKGSIIHGVSQKGCFDPLDTVINFAVPHENVLSGFCPVESMKDYKTVGPGKVEPVLNIYASSKREQSQILTFDGKKIIPNTAKTDLLGCEDADIEIKQLINESI